MTRTVVCGAALAAAVLTALAAQAVRAEPEQDLERQAAMAQRFDVFDKGGGQGWENAFPAPFVRAVPAGKSEPVPYSLKPGAYMIVVLCNCRSMKVTLVDANGKKTEPLRSNEQAAMYSLDVADDAGYLTGIDMAECDEDACDVGIKVYRKKS
jgi:hypothetical protein